MKNIVLFVMLFCSTISFAIGVDFETFNIRNNDSSITAPWDSDMVITENGTGSGFSASTPRSGQKVGYGTNALDGMQVNLIQTANFNVITNTTGKSIIPYLNIWVTDGTNYAIISSENDYRGTDFTTRQEWKIYEYDTTKSLDWLFDEGSAARENYYLTLDGSNITLDQISSNITIADPGIIYPSYVGTGAPRGGYGFNIIMGDTAANYVGGFEIADVSVTVDGTVYNAVPEPASMALLGLGGLLLRRRKA